MLKNIIDATRLDPAFCAALLRVSQDDFNRWLDGKEALPSFVAPELATILGVAEQELLYPTAAGTTAEELAPPVWFKLRSENLSQADREFVGIVRKIGLFVHQLQSLKGVHSSDRAGLIATVRSQVDRSAPPAIQGRQAAKAFRELRKLDQTQSGIAHVLRGHLRSLGILIIETPLKPSTIEGCCFEVGPPKDATPCIFANSYKSTWFRRNAVIAHELGHAVMDLDHETVSIDYRDFDEQTTESVREQRAQSFSVELLAPAGVLERYANSGINFSALDVHSLSRLVAEVGLEKRTLIRAALTHGLLDDDQARQAEKLDIDEELRSRTERALGTSEFLAKTGQTSPKWKAENRRVRVANRSVLLPVPYVQAVLEALRTGQITQSKAAEMLLTDRYSFRQRFGELGELAS